MMFRDGRWESHGLLDSRTSIQWTALGGSPVAIGARFQRHRTSAGLRALRSRLAHAIDNHTPERLSSQTIAARLSPIKPPRTSERRMVHPYFTGADYAEELRDLVLQAESLDDVRGELERKMGRLTEKSTSM